MTRQALLLLMFAPMVTARPYDPDSARMFDAKKTMTSSTTITVEYVKDVQGRCEQESRSRGLNGFGVALESCAFWGKRANLDVCHVIVPKKVSLVTLGHEFAHCFFGSWH